MVSMVGWRTALDVERLPERFDAGMTVEETVLWCLRALDADESEEPAITGPSSRLYTALHKVGCRGVVGPVAEHLQGLLWRLRATTLLASPGARRKEHFLATALREVGGWVRASSSQPPSSLQGMTYILELTTTLIAALQRSADIELAFLGVALAETLGHLDEAARDRVLSAQLLERSQHTETRGLGEALIESATHVSTAQASLARFVLARRFDDADRREVLTPHLDIPAVAKAYVADLVEDGQEHEALSWMLERLASGTLSATLERLSASLAESLFRWPEWVASAVEGGHVASPEEADARKAELELRERIESARELLERDRFAEVVTLLKRSTRERHTHLVDEVRDILSVAHLELGQPEKALAQLQRLDDTPEIAARKGRAFLALGKHTDAVEHFSTAFGAGYRRESDAVLLARAHTARGQFVEAEHALDSAGSSRDAMAARRALANAALEMARERCAAHPIEARGLLGVVERNASDDMAMLQEAVLELVRLDAREQGIAAAKERLIEALTSRDQAQAWTRMVSDHLETSLDIAELTTQILLEHHEDWAETHLFAARLAHSQGREAAVIEHARAGLELARRAAEPETAAELAAMGSRALIREHEAFAAAEMLLDTLAHDALLPSLLVSIAQLMRALGRAGFQGWLEEASRRLERDRVVRLMEALAQPETLRDSRASQPAPPAQGSIAKLYARLELSDANPWLADLEELGSSLDALNVTPQRAVPEITSRLARQRRGETPSAAAPTLVASVPHPLTEMGTSRSPWNIRPSDRASSALKPSSE